MTDAERCTAGWCADDDWCALTCAAAVLDRKWHPVILDRLLADGPQGFSRLEERIDDVSSTVLSDSLQALEDDGVVERRVLEDRPLRVEYSLTERGRDLEPVIDALRAWGREHVDAAATAD